MYEGICKRWGSRGEGKSEIQDYADGGRAVKRVEAASVSEFSQGGSWKVGVETTDLTLASAAHSGTLACIATGATCQLMCKPELQKRVLTWVYSSACA